MGTFTVWWSSCRPQHGPPPRSQQSTVSLETTTAGRHCPGNCMCAKRAGTQGIWRTQTQSWSFAQHLLVTPRPAHLGCTDSNAPSTRICFLNLPSSSLPPHSQDTGVQQLHTARASSDPHICRPEDLRGAGQCPPPPELQLLLHFTGNLLAPFSGGIQRELWGTCDEAQEVTELLISLETFTGIPGPTKTEPGTSTDPSMRGLQDLGMLKLHPSTRTARGVGRRGEWPGRASALALFTWLYLERNTRGSGHGEKAGTRSG